MRSNDKINILGTNLDCVDYKMACQRVKTYLESFDNKVIVTPNAEIIMAARENPELNKALNNADFCLPDGIGVVIASKILGKPLSERTTGYDFMLKLLYMADDEHLSLFLLGGKPGIAEEAAKKVKAMFKNIRITGFHHGYFKQPEEEVALSHDSCSQQSAVSSSPERKATERTKSLL